MKNLLTLTSILIIYSCGPKECIGLIYKDGITTQDGVLYTGKCMTSFSNNKIRSYQEYYRGKDHGEWVFYFKDGRVQTKGNFDKGLRVGKWEYFYPSGKQKQISNYNKNGKKDGFWITYDTIGLIRTKSLYSKDSLIARDNFK
tara:strand:+ start:216 stop:644 length:429 start_codon:yes stop_codon:yes gene_type:complete